MQITDGRYLVSPCEQEIMPGQGFEPMTFLSRLDRLSSGSQTTWPLSSGGILEVAAKKLLLGKSISRACLTS